MTETVSVIEASQLLITSDQTVLRLIDAGKLPAAKLGKSWVLFRDEVLEYLRSEIRRQTNERRTQHDTNAEVDSILGVDRGRVPGAPANPLLRRTPKRTLPDLDALEAQEARK